jgi:2,5-diketo-D-gluconate reductase A
MPVIGLGTSPMDDDQTASAVASALEAGYRLIDTAENYRNEVGVGAGLRSSGVPREDVFITTKFNRAWHSVDGARQAFEASAQRLGVDYVDLLLIHWPNPSYGHFVEAFEGLLALRAQGLIRAAGTSNFKPSHLEQVRAATGELPEVNQIQLNPTLTRDQARADHAEHGIVTEAWSPIGQGRELLDDDVVTELAGQLDRTPAQVVLRWQVQLGNVAIPKSADPRRQQQNLAVFDFELTDAQMARLSSLDRGEQAAADSDTGGH